MVRFFGSLFLIFGFLGFWYRAPGFWLLVFDISQFLVPDVWFLVFGFWCSIAGLWQLVLIWQSVSSRSIGSTPDRAAVVISR